MIEIVTFGWVPPFAQGLVRELRVRWALEEAGLAYTTRYIRFAERDSADYRALQPFGQVPFYVEDGLEMFESGAIVLHIAEKSEALMPRDSEGIASTRMWMFAALNSVEPAIQLLRDLNHNAAYQDVGKEIYNPLNNKVDSRLTALTETLGEKDYLCGRFTAADVLMTTVLRILRGGPLIQRHPALIAYQARCETRPAFRKALADHMEVFAQAPVTA
jgi:glutathione S-transferase